MKAAWPPASPHWDQLSRVFQENWTKQGAMSQSFGASYLFAQKQSDAGQSRPILPNESTSSLPCRLAMKYSGSPTHVHQQVDWATWLLRSPLTRTFKILWHWELFCTDIFIVYWSLCPSDCYSRVFRRLILTLPPPCDIFAQVQILHNERQCL